jgi:hypothetical protein
LSRGLWSTVAVARPIKLNERQVAVLRWIGEGCLHRDWPDESHKNTARALASRGLAEVCRKKKVWTATITSAGMYYLEHGRPEPRGMLTSKRVAAWSKTRPG